MSDEEQIERIAEQLWIAENPIVRARFDVVRPKWEHLAPLYRSEMRQRARRLFERYGEEVTPTANASGSPK